MRKNQHISPLSKPKTATLSIRNVLPIILLAAILLLSAVSCSSRKSASYRPNGVYHVVQPGQNLYRISLTYGVKLETVARVNGIRDVGSIDVGQRIFIPGAARLLDVPVVRPAAVAIPTILPVSGAITSNFGAWRSGHRHTGIDIAAPRGTKIKAAWDGIVIYSGKLSDYGLLVKIDHGNGLHSLYAHNDRNLVKRGQRVKKGEAIATVGNSGRTSGYHLHFEVRRNGKPVNPLNYINK